MYIKIALDLTSGYCETLQFHVSSNLDGNHFYDIQTLLVVGMGRTDKKLLLFRFQDPRKSFSPEFYQNYDGNKNFKILPGEGLVGHTENKASNYCSRPSKPLSSDFHLNMMKTKTSIFCPSPQQGVVVVDRTVKLASDQCSGPSKIIQFQISSKHDENKNFEILPPPQRVGGGCIIQKLASDSCSGP